MEESPEQQPLEKPTNKAIPDPGTDFGDEQFDYAAMPRGKASVGGFNEWLFSLMRPKKKGDFPKQARYQQMVPAVLPSTRLVGNVEEWHDREIQNGLLLYKKSLAERVRDQLKFPVINKFNGIINGICLIVFITGAFIIYSELPTRPELVLGILMVTIAGNVIVSSR